MNAQTPWRERVSYLPTPGQTTDALSSAQIRLMIANRYRGSIESYLAFLFLREKEGADAAEVFQNHVREEVLYQLSQPQDYVQQSFRLRLLIWVHDGLFKFYRSQTATHKALTTLVSDPTEWHARLDSDVFRRARREMEFRQRRDWWIIDLYWSDPDRPNRQQWLREEINLEFGTDCNEGAFRKQLQRCTTLLGNFFWILSVTRCRTGTKWRSGQRLRGLG